MFVQCRFCKYFKLTGETVIGTLYELGGECLFEAQKTCAAERYCNGGADACTKFECDLDGAKKIVEESSGDIRAIRDEYKKLYDKYRELSKRDVLNSEKVKAEMLDEILKLKSKGMDSCNIVNMLDFAEISLKLVQEND